MSRQCPLVLAILAFCRVTAARGQDAPGAADLTKVEAYLAAEHVPAGLKAGTRVDLVQVTGKSVTPAGKVSYSTTGLVQDIEDVSVTMVEQPKAPEQAVKVELKVTKEQAAVIERAKARLVTVTVATSDGQTKTERKSIPLRLELTRP
jgi:hypothetical protein